MASSSASVITRRLFRLLNNQGNRELEASLMYTGMAEWFRHNKLPGSSQWCTYHACEEREHAQKLFHHLSQRRVEATEPEEGAGAEGGAASEGSEGSGGIPILGTLLPPRIYRDLLLSEPPSGGTSNTAEAIPLQSEQPPESRASFEWDRVANVRLQVKDSFTADFEDPAQLWKAALEQEQGNSREYFKIMSEARQAQDYVTEQFIQSFYIPEQLEEEKAVEEILQNTLLVMRRGPDTYFELDRAMPTKPH